MHSQTWTTLGIIGFLSFAQFSPAAEYRVPGVNFPAQVREDVAVLPGGRVLKPFGRLVLTGNSPFAIACSPSGKTLVTTNIGVSPATGIERPSITIMVPGKRETAWNLTDFAAEPRQAKSQAWQGLSAGIVLSGENSAWISEGDTGRIVELNLTSGARKAAAAIGEDSGTGSFTGALAYDPARNLLAVADRGKARVVLVDGRKAVVLGSIRTGTGPAALAFSPDGKKLYVVTSGGRLLIVDAGNAADPKIASEVELTDGRKDSGPSGIAVNGDEVYVSLAHDDSIVMVSAQTGKITRSIPLRIAGLEEFRGITPLGLAFESKSRRLLIAEAGINAIAVVDPAAGRVLGHIPVGWFPNSIAVHGADIYVAAARGVGTGPSSPAHRIRMFGGGKPQFFEMETAALRRGSVSAFTLPDDKELERQTQIVMQANGFAVPRGTPAGKEPPPVKYVVLIEKGNRSFDEILGDVDHAGDKPVLGDASYARYGSNGYVSGGKVRFSLHVPVTPNHHEMAERWAFADNYYADGDFCVAGHRWLTGAIPDFESATALLYREAGSRSPGEIAPEGSLWEHLERNKVTGREFSDEGAASDQRRADEFIGAIRKDYVEAGKALPQFVLIRLPNDTAGAAHPEEGFPYEASWVADNDFALGRIVEFLSQTPWWKEMAVFVTERGAEGGADHIDSHRMLLLGAGPWFRSNYVSHDNASAPALLRTVFRILGVPPINLYDATAGDLLDMFGAVPDFKPYEVQAEDPRLFDPARAGKLE